MNNLPVMGAAHQAGGNIQGEDPTQLAWQPVTTTHVGFRSQLLGLFHQDCGQGLTSIMIIVASDDIIW